TAGLSPRPTPAAAIAAAALVFAVVFVVLFVARLETEVTADDLVIRFHGLWPTRRVKLADVVEHVARDYSIFDSGGWVVHWGLEEVGELMIVTSSLEEGRAKKESRATSVINWDRYGAQELAAQGVQGPELTATVIKRFLDERELARVALPAYFSVGIADRLREMGVELVVLNDLGERRRAKRPDELEAIEATQRATEEAWQLGVDALRRASVRKDRVLELDGAPFTADRLRAIVEVALLQRGCASDGAICAPGAQAADPHKIGEGPLHAGEPIVMDIFPQP